MRKKEQPEKRVALFVVMEGLFDNFHG